MQNNASGNVQVRGYPHPLRNTKIDSIVEHGRTVEEIVTAGLRDMSVPRSLWGHGHVYVGSEYIPRSKWGEVVPPPGAMVTYRMVPQGGGGGGKNPLRTLLTIAVIAIAAVTTMGVGSVLAGGALWGSGMVAATGWAAVGGAVAGAVVGGLGMMLVDAIAPIRPQSLGSGRSSAAESPNYSISGARNRLQQFGVVPVVLGFHRMVPPQVAMPYTENIGSDQYSRQLFAWGIGKYEITDIRIGETPIGSFNSYEIQTTYGDALTDGPLTLYQNDVHEDGVNVALTYAAGWQSRVTAIEADEFSLDIGFPQLVQYDSRGNKVAASVSFEAQFRRVGSATWTNFAGFPLTLSGAQTTAIRRTFKAVTGQRDQYEIRVRRTTADSTSSQVADQAYLIAVRSITYRAPVEVWQDLAMTALRIKATGQLNGSVDELNGMVKSVCLDWNKATGTWVERATNNPASLFRHVLQGHGNIKACTDDEINLTQLRYWHEFCAANGYTYNRVHDFKQSVLATLQDIAAAGRASVSRTDGLWSVTIDEPRTKVAQHITPRNSWGFKATRKLAERPHGLRVRFVNEQKQYQQDERLVLEEEGGEQSVWLFEVIELPGVTNPAHVYKLARHHMAVGKLRPEEYEVSMDFEHVTCERGDLVVVARPETMWGLGWARVKAVDGQVVTLDEPQTMIAGKVYAVRWRSVDGSSHVRDIETMSDTTETLTLAGAGDVPAKGDMLMFGERGYESAPMLVKRIVPTDNMCAVLTLVDYSPEVFNAASGPIPEHDSRITRPYPWTGNYVAKPSIEGIRSDESVLTRSADGTLLPRIAIEFGLPSGLAAAGNSVQAQYREVGTETWLTGGQAEISDGIVFVSPVSERTAYELRLRAVLADGKASEWTTYPEPHFVTGKTSPPPDVPVVMREGTRAVWTYPARPLDFAGFVVRWLYGEGSAAQWETALQAHGGLLTVAEFDFSRISEGTRTILVKAVDKAGNESTTAAMLVVDIGGIDVANVLASEEHRVLGWPGTKTGCAVGATGSLDAVSSDTFWPPSPALFWSSKSEGFWGSSYAELQYEGSYTLQPVDEGAGLQLTYDAAGTVLSVDYSTDGGVTWLPMPNKVEKANAGTYHFRIKIAGGRTRGVIESLVLAADVVDVREDIGDVAVSNAGTRLTLTKQYRVIKQVILTLQGTGGTAITARAADKSTSGPLVQCLGATGALVAGVVDASIIGY